MITSYPTLIPSTSVTNPTKIFTSSSTGAAIGGSVISQINAITTIALCNTGAVTPTDITVNSVDVNIYLVKAGGSYGNNNLIVSNLTIPAGETVFLSEERIVLDGGDEIWIGTSTDELLAVTISTLPV
jgi:hypothetical protein